MSTARNLHTHSLTLSVSVVTAAIIFTNKTKSLCAMGQESLSSKRAFHSARQRAEMNELERNIVFVDDLSLSEVEREREKKCSSY
jgi:hypothetical protein